MMQHSIVCLLHLFSPTIVHETFVVRPHLVICPRLMSDLEQLSPGVIFPELLCAFAMHC